MLRSLGNAFAARGLRLQIGPQLSACSSGFGQCRGLKETTGIVGLEVDPEARNNLLAASEDVLASVREQVPEDAQYRRNVEATFNYWVDQLKSDAPDDALEDQFNFQLEEMTLMAKQELQVVDKMAEWKPWEVPEGHQPEFISEQEVGERLDAATK